MAGGVTSITFQAAQTAQAAQDRAVPEPKELAPPAGMPTWAKAVLGSTAVAAAGFGVFYLLRGGGGQLLGEARRQPHTATVVLSNPHRPWLAKFARIAHNDAMAAQMQLFGSASGHIDDEVDAFRHAYASGLLKLRMMRDNGLTERAASKLVKKIGRAHELDGLDNPSALSALMDLFNNDAGIRLLGSGRTTNGAWIAEPALRTMVLDDLRSGGLRVLKDVGTVTERMVATTGSTLPRM